MEIEKTLDSFGICEQLHESSDIFAGLDSAQTDERRSRLITELATTGIIPEALPMLKEELEVGDSALCTAAAAYVLALSPTLPNWGGSVLINAISRYLYRDDAIRLKHSDGKIIKNTSVLTEISNCLLIHAPASASTELNVLLNNSTQAFSPTIKTILHEALRKSKSNTTSVKSCCTAPVQTIDPDYYKNLDNSKIKKITVENQYGVRGNFENFVESELNLLVFFYTRCMNAAKCSATIENLARLDKLIKAHQHQLPFSISLVALTYDPGFDTVERMKKYGEIRGIDKHSNVNLLRSVEGCDELMSHFRLGVGYGNNTVNRHSVESFIFDKNLCINHLYQREKFSAEKMLRKLRLLNGEIKV